MKSLFTDPFLFLAALLVLGWFAAALVLLQNRGAGLKRAVRELNEHVPDLGRAGGWVPDGTKAGASELPAVWRRIRASSFTAAGSGAALSRDPVDLVVVDDLVDGTRWYRFCAATPNYLVGLGLGFTFLGLVLALSSIDAKNLADPAQLTRLFAAMKFKFIASMLGIFTSIVFSIRLRWYLSGLQHMVADFQTALATHFPVVEPTVNALRELAARVHAIEGRIVESNGFAGRTASATERSLEVWGNVVEQLNTAATQLKKFNDELSISIGNVLEQRFQEKLLPPLADALKSLERAVNEVRDVRTASDGEMITGVVGEFRKAMNAGAATEINAIAGTLARVNEALAATQEDLQRVGKGIETNVVTGIQAAVSGLNTSVSALSERLTHLVTSASGTLTAQLDSATAKASNSFAAVTSTLDALLQQTQGVLTTSAGSAAATDRVLAQFGDVVDRFQEAQMAFGAASEPVQRATSRLETTAEAVRLAAESIERSAERAQELETRVSTTWVQCGERFEGVDKDLARIFTDLNQGLTSYASTVNEFNGRLTAEFTKALGSLQVIVGDLDETLQEMRAAVARTGP